MVARSPAAASAFPFRSGRPCLDFAATLMFRDTDEPRELLIDGAAFARWALESGVVSRPCRGIDGPGEAIELREAVYRFATARLAASSPAGAARPAVNPLPGHPPGVPPLPP